MNACGLQGSMLRGCSSPAHNHSPAPSQHPNPDPWRWNPPKPPFQIIIPVAWPTSLNLYLFSAATIAISMWFYTLHLKFCGYVSWFSWSEIMCKLIRPSIDWQHIQWFLALLPHCQFLTLLYFIQRMALADSRPSPTVIKPFTAPPKQASKPVDDSKQGRLRSIALASLAAIATVTTSNPMPLQSDLNFQRDLQRYKHPLGGLDTNKLSRSTSARSPHKALLTQLQNESDGLLECLQFDIPVQSAVVDSGASFTSIKDETLVVP